LAGYLARIERLKCFYLKYLKGRDYFSDLSIDRSIIVEWIVNK
jgi:hypothetical protein